MAARGPVQGMKPDPNAVILAGTRASSPAANLERGLLECWLELVRTHGLRSSLCCSRREGTDVYEGTSIGIEHLAEIAPRVLHRFSGDHHADVQDVLMG